MNRILSSIAFTFLICSTATGQGFHWFATTMSTADHASLHAEVMVLPESSWQVSDTSVTLTPEAVSTARAWRARGLKVVVSASGDAAVPALAVLWEGEVDGLVVPPGSLQGPVSRPENSVVLASSEAAEALDGAIVAAGTSGGDWAHADSLFAVRAPSVDRPTPAREIVRIASGSPVWHLLLPGSILLEGAPDGSEPVLIFRSGHAAIASGVHESLGEAPYAFYRGVRTSRDTTDEVVVVLGASGKTTVKVAAVFEDDTVLRETQSGQIAMVSYGQASFEAPDSGMLLIEVVR